MNQESIFLPFFAMILLTIVVWFYMYARRIPFLLKGEVGIERITPGKLAEISPPAVANPSDNLKNLFEIPVLFYALTLFLYETSHVDSIYLICAWTFVILRVLHSAVHCTINIIKVRFALYLVSTLVLWAMVVRAALQLLDQG